MNTPATLEASTETKDLVLRFIGGKQDGQLVSVTTPSCMLGINNSSNSQCAIYRGQAGAAIQSHGTEVLINGEAKSVHWLQAGDRVQLSNSQAVEVVELGYLETASTDDATPGSAFLETAATPSDAEQPTVGEFGQTLAEQACEPIAAVANNDFVDAASFDEAPINEAVAEEASAHELPAAGLAEPAEVDAVVEPGFVETELEVEAAPCSSVVEANTNSFASQATESPLETADTLPADIERRFETIDSTLDQLQNDHDQVTERFDRLEDSLTGLSEQLQQLSNQNQSSPLVAATTEPAPVEQSADENLASPLDASPSISNDEFQQAFQSLGATSAEEPTTEEPATEEPVAEEFASVEPTATADPPAEFATELTVEPTAEHPVAEETDAEAKFDTAVEDAASSIASLFRDLANTDDMETTDESPADQAMNLPTHAIFSSDQVVAAEPALDAAVPQKETLDASQSPFKSGFEEAFASVAEDASSNEDNSEDAPSEPPLDSTLVADDTLLSNRVDDTVVDTVEPAPAPAPAARSEARTESVAEIFARLQSGTPSFTPESNADAVEAVTPVTVDTSQPAEAVLPTALPEEAQTADTLSQTQPDSIETEEAEINATPAAATPKSDTESVMERLRSQLSIGQSAKTEPEPTETIDVEPVADLPESTESTKPKGNKDESVDDYMSMLLSRMRGGSEDAEETAPATPMPRPEATQTDSGETDTTATDSKLTEEEFRPRQKAAPIKSFDKMRELANSSSRSAIQRSIQTQQDERKKGLILQSLSLGNLALAAIMFSSKAYSAGAAFAVMFVLVFGYVLYDIMKPSELVNAVSTSGSSTNSEAADATETTEPLSP